MLLLTLKIRICTITNKGNLVLASNAIASQAPTGDNTPQTPSGEPSANAIPGITPPPPPEQEPEPTPEPTPTPTPEPEPEPQPEPEPEPTPPAPQPEPEPTPEPEPQPEPEPKPDPEIKPIDTTPKPNKGGGGSGGKQKDVTQKLESAEQMDYGTGVSDSPTANTHDGGCINFGRPDSGYGTYNRRNTGM